MKNLTSYHQTEPVHLKCLILLEFTTVTLAWWLHA